MHTINENIGGSIVVLVVKWMLRLGDTIRFNNNVFSCCLSGKLQCITTQQGAIMFPRCIRRFRFAVGQNVANIFHMLWLKIEEQKKVEKVKMSLRSVFTERRSFIFSAFSHSWLFSLHHCVFHPPTTKNYWVCDQLVFSKLILFIKFNMGHLAASTELLLL